MPSESFDPLHVAGAAAVVYVAVLVLTRLGGLRSFAKLTSFDFALTVAIGSMVASAITGDGAQLLTVLVGLAATFALHIGFAILRRWWPWLARLANNEPLLLADGSGLIADNLRRGHVTEADVRSQLRLAGVTDMRRVRAVVMETTGEVSVLLGDPDGPPLDPDLMDGVRTPHRSPSA